MSMSWRSAPPGALHGTWPNPAPQGKTFATFEFAAVPTLRKAHVLAGAGDAWLEQGANILLFGPSGSGKSHVAAAIGHALIDTGRRVLFSPHHRPRPKAPGGTPGPWRCRRLPAKLDRYDCLILDDLGYARKDQAETTVLFRLIAERYERRSLIVTTTSRSAPGTRSSPTRR